jgi:hypothetical protein
MSKPVPSLAGSAGRVFTEIRTHKAMPLFEIAAATGIRGEELDVTVKGLEEQNLVTVKGADPAHTIVSVSGSYY